MSISASQKRHETLDQLSNSALDFCRSKSLGPVKISASSDESLRVVMENGELSLAQHLSSAGFGVALHQDKKRGSSTANTLIADDIYRAIDQAHAISQYSIEDPYLIMASPEIAPPAPSLDFLFDSQMSSISQDQLQTWMQEVLESKLRHPKLLLERFEVALSTNESILANSHGMKQSEAQTSLWWSFMGMAKDGEEVSGMDYVSHFSYRNRDIKERMLKDADDFALKLLSNLGANKCPAYSGQVLLSPRALRSLILSTIMFHASGSQVMDDKSRWKSMVGQRVASEWFHLEDLPHLERMAGASSYDSDGLSTRRNPILSEGRLVHHLHSCYSAHRCGVQSNGFAGGAFGLTMQAGKDSLTAMQAARNELLVIDRFSGNVDPLTGDFSGVAKTSKLYRNGSCVGPVQETMVSGNSFELMNAVVAISKELVCESGSFEAPWVLVDKITVS